MPKLYLHIGHPKTGTTSLQQFLATNDQALAKAGVLYPTTGRLHDAHYKITFSLGLGHYHAMAEIESPAAYAAALREEIRASGAEKVILSSEYFSVSRDPKTVRAYFADYDVDVVLYLRRHDDALESSYKQSVKTHQSPPWGPTIDSFIDHQIARGSVSQSYLSFVESWAAAFGQEHMIVRPFEKAQNRPNLYVDFLHSIGVTTMDDLPLPAAEANTSMATAEIVVAVDAVQRAKISNEMKQLIVGMLVRQDGASRKTDRVEWISPAKRASLVERYAADYEAIARRFMGRDDGRLFVAPVPKADASWAMPERPAPETMVNLVLRAIAPHIKS